MMSDPESQAADWKDEDLVYVDPETKTIVGRVEFAGDKPKSLPYQAPVKKESTSPEKKGKKGDKPDRPFWRKFYPFGTLRSMKKVYKVMGKTKEPEPNRTLEEVLPKALSEAYWSWDDKKIDA